MSLLQDKIDHLQWWLDTIGFEKVSYHSDFDTAVYVLNNKHQLSISGMCRTIYKHIEDIDSYEQTFKVKELIEFLETTFSAEIRKGKIKEILNAS